MAIKDDILDKMRDDSLLITNLLPEYIRMIHKSGDRDCLATALERLQYTQANAARIQNELQDEDITPQEELESTNNSLEYAIEKIQAARKSLLLGKTRTACQILSNALETLTFTDDE